MNERVTQLGGASVIDEEGPGWTAPPWWRQPWFVVSVATTIAIVWATGRGLARGFEPIGDNALVELRARDVFTPNHPWLGTWSSASVSSGQDLNHPGPFQFDVFALPVRLFGSRVGIAGGGALINLGAVWGGTLVARRAGGPIMALAVAVAAGGLAWSLGSELLYDVWMPNILVLPAFAFLVLIWAVVAGRVAALPIAVAVGSFCAQVHVSYVFLAPALLLAALVVVLVRDRRRPGTFRLIGLAVVVGLILWAQPIWEQLTGDGDGNLTRLATSTDGGDDRVGLALAVRMLANVVVVPPGWLRPGFDDSIPLSPWIDDGAGRRLSTDGIVGLPYALAALLVVLVGGVALHRATRRIDDRTTAAGLAVLVAVAAVALATTTISPVDGFGLAPHKFRYLFAVGALAAAVALGGGLRLVARTSLGQRRVGGLQPGPALLGLVGVIVAALTLPTYRAAAGPDLQHATWSTVRSLRDQLDPLEQAGTVWFDLDGQVFAEPYSWPIMAEMVRRGVPFQVSSSGDVRQVGDDRAFTPAAADTRLFYLTGDAADSMPPGATRIALAGSGRREDPVVAIFMAPYEGGAGG